MQTTSQVDLVLSGRKKDLGGFSVRRILPQAVRRMVGPFIFFDHIGPAKFGKDQGIEVRPHPHIGLATVTYFFEGDAYHRDSLGSRQLIEPGAINWMTAGRGIVHSERTPEEEKRMERAVNGIQCWVALPTEDEDMEPHFAHIAKINLPEFKVGKSTIQLLAGTAYGRQAPTPTRSDLFYVRVQVPKLEDFEFDSEGRQGAVYIVTGLVEVERQSYGEGQMLIASLDGKISVRAKTDCQLMLLGGASVGDRHIWWNLVSSSFEKIEAAKKDWSEGPRETSARFRPIPGDAEEFIPLPDHLADDRGFTV